MVNNTSLNTSFFYFFFRWGSGFFSEILNSFLNLVGVTDVMPPKKMYLSRSIQVSIYVAPSSEDKMSRYITGSYRDIISRQHSLLLLKYWRYFAAVLSMILFTCK